MRRVRPFSSRASFFTTSKSTGLRHGLRPVRITLVSLLPSGNQIVLMVRMALTSRSVILPVFSFSSQREHRIPLLTQKLSSIVFTIEYHAHFSAGRSKPALLPQPGLNPLEPGL